MDSFNNGSIPVSRHLSTDDHVHCRTDSQCYNDKYLDFHPMKKLKEKCLEGPGSLTLTGSCHWAKTNIFPLVRSYT